MIRRRFLSFSCSFSVGDEIERAYRKKSGGEERKAGVGDIGEGNIGEEDGGLEKEGKAEVENLKNRNSSLNRGRVLSIFSNTECEIVLLLGHFPFSCNKFKAEPQPSGLS